ncbi:MAG: beta-phosphoglucomutase family hydrolase [Bacteroidota bacterium]|nr:beta-phosphoglucomutase family hydrolase [Bacteroidota bacterium]
MKKLDINPKAKGLIFDLDGTIADTMPAHYRAWRDACKHFGIDFSTDLFIELAGIPLIPTAKKLNEIFGTNIDPEELGYRKENAFMKTIPLTRPIEPVVSIIRKYYGILPMAVGTGGSRDIAWQTLEAVGVSQYFEILVGAEDIKNPKPHPETFLRCAEQIGVQPEYCEVFEDGKLGLQAARTANMISTDVTPYYEITIGEEVL